ncbi:hypothetical protein D3C75_1244780 [compost metagenome]
MSGLQSPGVAGIRLKNNDSHRLVPATAVSLELPGLSYASGDEQWCPELIFLCRSSDHGKGSDRQR